MNTNHSIRLASARLGLLAAALLVPTFASAQIVFSSSGATAGDIQASVDSFRAALGTLNPNNGSAFSSGRREINWDAVPDIQSDPNAFSGDFFAQAFNGANAGRTRGAVFTNDASFLVSANNPGPNQVNDLFRNRTNATFGAFSNDQIFAPLGSTTTEVTFVVPGTSNVAANVTAFGAVFLDVEANTSIMEFFAPGGGLLGRFGVPTSGNGGFSFLGVNFGATALIERIIIHSGDISFGNDSPLRGLDVVAMDDFIYSEPLAANFTAVPEPSTYGLIGAAALVGVVALRRRRTASK